MNKRIGLVLFCWFVGVMFGIAICSTFFPTIVTETEHITETEYIDRVEYVDRVQYVQQIEYKYIYTTAPEPKFEYGSWGVFEITAYCPCEICCGKSDGITATGAKATEGRTIAADPNVLPYGTKVIINGHEYTVEDCGGSIKGNRIDLYFDSHDDALQWGRQTLEIFVSK